jgi:hypothetical protein
VVLVSCVAFAVLVPGVVAAAPAPGSASVVVSSDGSEGSVSENAASRTAAGVSSGPRSAACSVALAVPGGWRVLVC